MKNESEISTSEIADIINALEPTKVEDPVKTLNEANEANKVAEIAKPAIIEKKEPVKPEPAKEAPKPAPAKKTIIGGSPVVVGRRAKDNVQAHLENFKNATTAGTRISALAKVVDIVVKFPKKAIFDEIFEFFLDNRQEAFLQENTALQGITLLDPTIHQRVRILYMVMITIARGNATRRNISIELLRNIFSNDDFANWVAVKLSRR